MWAHGEPSTISLIATGAENLLGLTEIGLFFERCGLVVKAMKCGKAVGIGPKPPLPKGGHRRAEQADPCRGSQHKGNGREPRCPECRERKPNETAGPAQELRVHQLP